MARYQIQVLILVLLLISSTSGQTIGNNDNRGKLHHLNKDGEKKTSPRKLMFIDMVQLDYDYAGPNTKHDPRKGKGGSGRIP